VRRLGVCLAILSVLACACASTPRSHTDIGMARVGLTVAFSNQALASAPVPPRVIVVLIPAPPSLLAERVPDLTPYVAPSLPTVVPTTTPLLPLALCPPALPGASVPGAPPLIIDTPPVAGTYKMVNSGTIKVTTDGFTFNFPYPPLTTMVVKDVKTSTVDTVPGVPSLGATSETTFEEVTTLTPTDVITETYEYSASQLALVSHYETNAGKTTGDTFSPPVEVYDTGGVGTSWEGLGADAARLEAMSFEGAIHATRVVDACGSLVDTMEVTSTSTLADLQTAQTSGTTPGDSDITDVATGLGGLFAARHFQQTDVETVNNAAVTIVYNVTSKLDGLTPTPTPTPTRASAPVAAPAPAAAAEGTS